MDNNMQENIKSDFTGTSDKEESLKDFIISIRDWVRYFWSKKIIIIIVGVAGAGLGFLYALNKEPVYTATTSFVLETGSTRGALSSYAGIASAFGIDLSSAGGGLFEGENILELYRSRNMISKVLLSEEIFEGKKQLLIERYIDFNKLRNIWEKKSELKNIRFKQDNQYTDARAQLLHDSIMSQIVKGIVKGNLEVVKKDKKLNIIYVTVRFLDELFAKSFNEKLVQNVNNFYLETKAKKNLENVVILQAKTDSVRGLMTGAINRAVEVADATPNQNPSRMTPRIAPIESAKASAEVNKEILSELIKNLELSKISLSKETPLIRIVDGPILPLEKMRFGKLKGLILGGFLSAFIILVFLIVQKIINDALKSV